jgi:hypothetical protein
MMTPAEVDRWCDAFWFEVGRTPYWDEIIKAVQADALGLPIPPPMTEEKITAAGEEHVRMKHMPFAATAMGAAR